MKICLACKVTYGDPEQVYCLYCGAALLGTDEAPTLDFSQPAIAKPKPPRATPKSSNVLEFNRSVNRGIVANNVTIRSSRAGPKMQPPPGSIASNLPMRNYAKYLIDRYQEFKRSEVGEAFRYQVFYSAIKAEFKCKWDMIPVSRFDALVDYLQKRIDNTALGRNYKKQGRRRYHSYGEHLQSYSE